MKVVLDTNCLVVWLPVTSPYYCLWSAFRDRRITLCYTTDIINEYSEVLARFYSQQFVSDVINELLLSFNAIKANNYYKWNLLTDDPDDNKFVDGALNAGADYLVSNDRHFEILKSVEFPPIAIIDIKTFKKIISMKSV
ncbi:MAG: putative toxin-antitoxin system toxin component, PIN family [Prevotellaceae bacterium]|jgi:putative PIN family toxin of toxin-antitoxin system|nr:putative toxin-antitoxin system toxin component, PIN family [Prevotellaceae bacterium]